MTATIGSGNAPSRWHRVWCIGLAVCSCLCFVQSLSAQPRSRLSNVAPTQSIAMKDMKDAGNQPVTIMTLDEPFMEVRIEGNIIIPAAEIQKHIQTRPERIATQGQIKDDVDALIRTRWFVSVAPLIKRSDKGAVLTYRVLERPLVRNVEYRGLVNMKQELLEAITNLKAGSPYDVSANRENARRIEELYHEKGYAFATVKLEKGKDRNDREVIFLITEGPKTR